MVEGNLRKPLNPADSSEPFIIERKDDSSHLTREVFSSLAGGASGQRIDAAVMFFVDRGEHWIVGRVNLGG